MAIAYLVKKAFYFEDDLRKTISNYFVLGFVNERMFYVLFFVFSLFSI